MTAIDNSKESNESEIPNVWSRLSEAHRAEFWAFAAIDAKGLRNGSSTHKALCNAIHAAERNGTARKAVKGLPIVTRGMSAADLQKSISRLKDRLIEQPEATPFLWTALQRWTKNTRRKTLLEVLDALDCKRDNEGSLAKGESVPTIDSTAASEKISALLGVHSAPDLMLVCNILMLDSNWSGLEQTWERLRSLPENPIAIGDVTESSLDRNEVLRAPELTPSVQINSVIDTEFFDELELLITELQKKLSAHAAALGGGEFLPREETIDLWDKVEKKFDSAANSLQVKTTKVSVLRNAVAVAKTSALTLSKINECRKIVHCTDASFSGIHSIKSHCEKLEQRLQSEVGTLSEKELKALDGLLELVAVGASLDDETATQHQGYVQDIFGNVVATAALRNKLRFTEANGVIEGVNSATQRVAEKTKIGEIEVLEDTSQPLESDETQGQKTEAKSPEPEKTTVQPAEIEPESKPDQALAHSNNSRETPVTVANDSSKEFTDQQGALNEKFIEGDTARLVQSGEVSQVVKEPPEAIKKNISPKLNPTEALSFAKFASQYWVDISGKVQPAPWSQSEFAQRLQKNALKYWNDAEFGAAVLCARGLYEYNKSEIIRVEEVEKAARLLEEPENLPLIRDPQRAPRLLENLESTSHADVPIDYGLQVVLESLSPSEPFTLSSLQIDSVIARANFSDPALVAVLSFILKGWAAGIDQIGFLQEQSKLDKKLDPSTLQKSITQAEETLQNLVQKMWRGAGGKIQHTHSRNAWLSFMVDHVQPFVQMMIPDTHKFNEQRVIPSTKRVREEFTKLSAEFHRLMAEAEVRFKDLKAAKDGVEQIIRAIDALSKLLEQKIGFDKRQQSANQAVPLQETQRILNEVRLAPNNRLYVLLLRAVLTEKAQPSIFQIEAGVLVRMPDLVRFIDPSVVAGSQFTSKGINPLWFSQALPAAALFTEMDRQNLPKYDDDLALLTGVMDVASSAGRADILAALSPTKVLQGHERAALHGSALSLGDLAFNAAQKLEHQWAVCNELFSPEDSKIRALVEESKTLTSFGVGRNSLSEVLLIEAWLEHATAFAHTAQNLAIDEQLRIATERSAELGETVRALFDVGDYRGGVTLIHGEFNAVETEFRPTRKTIWRKDARQRYLSPKTYLITKVNHKTSEQQHLVREWVEGDRNQPGHLDSIRKGLYAMVSGEAGKTAQQNVKRFSVKLSELREHKESKTVIPCIALRKYFAGAKLNPTFLPQLVDFSQIVIFSSEPLSARFANAADSWIKALGNEAAGTIGVFLEPGISESRRNELTSIFRRRGATIAIIDDIDLCRLCEATDEGDGHNFIPFLELIFEQLDLEKVSPFLSHDGQHVRLETYIGRKADAEKVALGWTYTRVFSGRKLGKSAFLKYVAHTYNEAKVTSGNTLHVFFITIAGGESENWIVDCIISEMVSRFALPENNVNSKHSPAERFSTYMKRFIAAKPTDNVLLILDEADAFVERQLFDYDEAREGSLSFRMMKEIPIQTDKNEMPRVRTILSGYRVTNTSGGVWANAGEVLILKPLLEDEAVHFLSGLLSNIGINLGTHTRHVARRCGFQPAVLIRFGNALIRRLKSLKASVSRETIEVEHDDVVAALQEQSVVSEIRTVVNNNFQSNRIGAAVFGATLLALKDLQPGLALENGPANVLAKLIEIDPDISWLERYGAPPASQIERQLQDFIDRELLTVIEGTKFGVREYRLKFPHFLPVLIQHSEIGLEVRQNIHAARNAAVQQRSSESILPNTTLATIRHWYQQSDRTFCQTVAVGSQWNESLLNEKSGIPDRLGCEHRSIVRVSNLNSVSKLVGRQERIVAGCKSETALELLMAPSSRPRLLIGGVGFLRSMLHQADEAQEVLLEIASLGEIPEHALGWWFEETRALHFSSVDAVSKIKATTGGIPFFVREFDKLLPNAAGTDVTEQELERAIADFESALPTYADTLMKGNDDIALSPREFELLAMITGIGTTIQDEFDLETEFETSWEMWALENPNHYAAPMSEKDDRISVNLLARIGLISTFSIDLTQLGKVKVQRDGVVARMLRVIGKVSAN